MTDDRDVSWHLYLTDSTICTVLAVSVFPVNVIAVNCCCLCNKRVTISHAY